MLKILVYGMTDNLGGIETFLLSYIENISPKSIQFDFIAPYQKISIEEQVLERGGNVFHIPRRGRNFCGYQKAIRQFMNSHAAGYDIVWLNDCMFCNLDILKLAKKYGVPTRIIHAHNSQAMGSKLQLIRHALNKPLIPKVATEFWACSSLAADWSFPKAITTQKSYSIIPNAIETQRYRFNPEIRSRVRQQMGLQQKFVVGNVGRLHFQKNQMFLLDIFNEIVQSLPDAVLLLVGSGEDEDKLKSKARVNGIDDKVVFLGTRLDVPDLLQAMDIFIMPSLFEGLGIVSIEAQAAGLPCLMSDVLPKETKVTVHSDYLSLNDNVECWANRALEMATQFERKDSTFSVKEHGFDIKQAAWSLEEKLKGYIEK